jgi:hypothetical protein
MNPKEHLDFHVQKDVIYLYKNFLSLIQDIKEDHGLMLKKLKDALPDKTKLIDTVDYMDANRQAYYRKKILDWGNGSIRALQKQLELFDIDFNK